MASDRLWRQFSASHDVALLYADDIAVHVHSTFCLLFAKVGHSINNDTNCGDVHSSSRTKLHCGNAGTVPHVLVYVLESRRT